jgi:hypothetical protein
MTDHTERVVALADGDPARLRRLTALADTLDPARTDDDWQLLVPHRLLDGRWLSAANVRTLYLHLTDSLVHRLASGFDRVICLDKSARPVGWLLATCWDLLAPTFTVDAHGRPRPVAPAPARPRITFLNIDRLQWRELIDPLDVGVFDIDRLPDDVIQGLRQLFLVRPADAARTGAALFDAPTFLTGERILVVDEVSVSGDTASIATGILRRAFPDAAFEPGHWMRPKLVAGRDGNRRNNLLPVWYRDDTNLGRGVDDRDPHRSLDAPSWWVRAGAWFLSRPHRPTSLDRPGTTLRAELTQLAARALCGTDILVPSFDRDPDEAAARAAFYTGMDLPSLRQWREANGILLDV